MQDKFKSTEAVTGIMKTKHVELDITDLEWEIVDAALKAPISELLLQHIKDYQMGATEDELNDAWDSITAKWEATG